MAEYGPLEQIKRKCEQYWNENHIGVTEVHAMLAFIHVRAAEVKAEVESLEAELKDDRGVRAVVMNEQYAELDGLPEKSMRIYEAIRSLRQQVERQRKLIKVAVTTIAGYYEACRNDDPSESLDIARSSPAVEDRRRMVFAIGSDLKRHLEQHAATTEGKLNQAGVLNDGLRTKVERLEAEVKCRKDIDEPRTFSAGIAEGMEAAAKQYQPLVTACSRWLKEYDHPMPSYFVEAFATAKEQADG